MRLGPEQVEAVAAAIRASTGNPHVEVEQLELGSLKDIRAFTQRFLARHPTLHILVNNAGVMASPPAKTADGFELQFGSNHVGHFLMTCLLAPALHQAAPSRVVSVSSRGHHMSPVVFDDIQFQRRPYDKWLAYGQAKTANVLFAVGLERRLGARGVHANALHPGGIMTELGRHLDVGLLLDIVHDLARRLRALVDVHAEGGGSVTRAKTVHSP